MKLKPFNLEEAKAGKRVVDRLGRPQRILAFDLNCEEYPIAATMLSTNYETVTTFSVKGFSVVGTVNDSNLFMAPEWYENIPEKGVLCWVSDIKDKPDNKCRVASIKWWHYEDGFYYECGDSPWKYATPLSSEEVQAYLDTAKGL